MSLRFRDDGHRATTTLTVDYRLTVHDLLDCLCAAVSEGHVKVDELTDLDAIRGAARGALERFGRDGLDDYAADPTWDSADRAQLTVLLASVLPQSRALDLLRHITITAPEPDGTVSSLGERRGEQ